MLDTAVFCSGFEPRLELQTPKPHTVKPLSRLPLTRLEGLLLARRIQPMSGSCISYRRLEHDQNRLLNPFRSSTLPFPMKTIAAVPPHSKLNQSHRCGRASTSIKEEDYPTHSFYTRIRVASFHGAGEGNQEACLEHVHSGIGIGHQPHHHPVPSPSSDPD